MGHFIYGWRQVPVDITALGEKAMATRPEIEQIMFSMPQDISEQEAECQLYLMQGGGSKKLFWQNWLLIFTSALCQHDRLYIRVCFWQNK